MASEGHPAIPRGDFHQKENSDPMGKTPNANHEEVLKKTGFYHEVNYRKHGSYIIDIYLYFIAARAISLIYFYYGCHKSTNNKHHWRDSAVRGHPWDGPHVGHGPSHWVNAAIVPVSPPSIWNVPTFLWDYMGYTWLLHGFYMGYIWLIYVNMWIWSTTY